MLPSTSSILSFIPRPLLPLATKIIRFGPQSLALYSDYTTALHIAAALVSSTSHKSPFFPSLSRPFAPLPRPQFLHLRRTRKDVSTAGPTAAFCLLPVVGYFGVLGAFLKPRFFLSRQFYEDGEREKLGWEDVRARVENYGDVKECLRISGCDIGEVRRALVNLGEGVEGDAKVNEVLKNFREKFELGSLSKKHLVALAASRGINR